MALFTDFNKFEDKPSKPKLDFGDSLSINCVTYSSSILYN